MCVSGGRDFSQTIFHPGPLGLVAEVVDVRPEVDVSPVRCGGYRSVEIPLVQPLPDGYGEEFE